MDDMLKDFVVEALELAVDVEEKLLQLERFPDDPEAINAVSSPQTKAPAPSMMESVRP